MKKYTLLINQARTIKAIRINSTNEIIRELDQPDLYKKLAKQARIAMNRQARDQAMSDLGLVKVKGIVSGKTYYE